MQLLRDNLTLWTSSDSAEAEGGTADAPKETEKPKADEAKAEAPSGENKTEEAPAQQS